MQNNWKPFGKNIMFQPQAKDKVIGDTSKYFLYGKVLAVGSEVIKVKSGDTIAYTQWALNKIVMASKDEYFFVKEDDDFILAVYEA
jgi:co-chaperonin GroES (HSP10)